MRKIVRFLFLFTRTVAERMAGGLIGVLEGVIHDDHESQPSLPGCGEDLAGWQDETIATSVPQLKGVGVLDSLVVGPVNGSTAGLV